jgi:hypothetical protein
VGTGEPFVVVDGTQFRPFLLRLMLNLVALSRDALVKDLPGGPRFLRHLDRLGYAHYRRWKLFGEETLARHPAMIWLHGDALTVESEGTPLAQYTVRYQPDKKHFKDVPDAKRFETPYRSPQGWLWDLDDTMWKLAKRLPDYAPRKRRKKTTLIQPPLLEELQTTQAKFGRTSPKRFSFSLSASLPGYVNHAWRGVSRCSSRLSQAKWWAYGLGSHGRGAGSSQSPLYPSASDVGWSGISRRRHPGNRGWCGSWFVPAWRMSLPSRVQVELWLCRHAIAIHRVPRSL